MSLLFAKTMGVFWLFAEGLILIYLRRGYIYLRNGEAQQKTFVYFCITAFLLLSYLIFSEEIDLARLFGVEYELSSHLHRRYVWNFVCTLWVAIEAAIAIYVFRIYNILKIALEKHKPLRDKAPVLGPVAFFLLLLLFYIAYHSYLGLLSESDAYDYRDIRSFLVFYIKICGIFWILIEWAVALAGLKILLLLRKKAP